MQWHAASAGWAGSRGFSGVNMWRKCGAKYKGRPGGSGLLRPDVSQTAAFGKLLRPDTKLPSTHGDKAGLPGHPLQPAADMRIIAQSKLRCLADMGIGIQRDIGEGDAVAHHPVAGGEMLVHQ